MHLHSYRLRNFRHLKDAHIELADDISIFVGSNQVNNPGRANVRLRDYVYGPAEAP